MSAQVAVRSQEATTIQRPHRWATPFGGEMGPAEVERVLASPIFAAIDAHRFPASASLADIITNDARLVRLDRGDIVVREGDYGSSVFVILSGSVRVVLDHEASRSLTGRREMRRGSWWRALTQGWSAPRAPEIRDVALYQSVATSVREGGTDRARTYVKDLDRLLQGAKTIEMGSGQMFGEIAALSRSPRTASIVADGPAELVELRWQGLRDIRRRDPGFRESVDSLYRSRNLSAHLAETPLLAHLDSETLDRIAEQTLFESYGNLEWFSSFKQIVAHDPSEVIAHEPIIAEEGNYLDGLVIVRSGFARVSRRLDHGHRTVGYLTANEVFGLREIVCHWRDGAELCLQSSLRAVGFVDVLRVPTDLLEELVLPGLGEETIARATAAIPSADAPAWADHGANETLEQSLLDALVDSRLINGQASMVINADRCVDCDECVAACAATHEGNPRFVRHGPSHGALMFATACMHCVDPVCLVGCPTGAIHRDPEHLRVLIDDATCIGCRTCAESCPYDSIRMVDIRDTDGRFVVDEESGTPIAKATKCDLCAEQLGGPACERACPHDALVRVDMRDRRRFAGFLRGVVRRGRRLRTLALVALGVGALIAANELWECTLHHSNVLSGWALLAAFAALLLLAGRKRLPAAPLGDLSRWLRAHWGWGILGGVAFVLHAGLSPPPGRLESALWLLFLAVAASGAVGLLLSRWIPERRRRHGELILYERIPAFRRMLARRVEGLAMQSVRETASGTLADFYAQRLGEFFDGPRNRLGHLVESNRSVLRLRREVRHLERYLDDRGREILDEIDRCIVAKNNLDYQEALHDALRSWRRIHVPLTWSLVLLVVVHVLLVLTFSGGAL